MKRNENPYSIYGEEDTRLQVMDEEPANMDTESTTFKKIVSIGLSLIVIGAAVFTYHYAMKEKEKEENNYSEEVNTLPLSMYYTAPAGFTLKIVDRKVMAVKEVRIYPPFAENLNLENYREEYDEERQEKYLVQTIMMDPTIVYFNPETQEVHESGLGK